MKVVHVPFSTLPIQRDVVQKILIKHLFNNAMYEEGTNPTYDDEGKPATLPVHEAVIVRTAYSNKVLVHEPGDGKSSPYIISVIGSSPLVPKPSPYHLDFLLETTAASLFMSCVPGIPLNDYGVRKCLGSGVFQVLGLYNPDPCICDPVIVVCMIFSDDAEGVFSKYLCEGHFFAPISSIMGKGLIKAILDQIVEVDHGCHD